METEFKVTMDALRGDIQATAKLVWNTINLAGETTPKDEIRDPGILKPASYLHQEMIENIVLAYRHLEDARMRLGKAIQAYEGGESIYDKPKG